MDLLNNLNKTLVQKQGHNLPNQNKNNTDIKAQSDYEKNNMDYFFFDDYKNIERKKKLDIFDESNDRIFLYFKENKRISQKLYKRKDFENDYYFIKVENKAKETKPIGLIFPKGKFELNFIKQHISSEIQNSAYKDIFKHLKMVGSKKFELEELNDTKNNEKFFVRSFDIKELNSKDTNQFRSSSGSNANANIINNPNNGRNNRTSKKKIYQIKPDNNTNAKFNQVCNNKPGDPINNNYLGQSTSSNNNNGNPQIQNENFNNGNVESDNHNNNNNFNNVQTNNNNINKNNINEFNNGNDNINQNNNNNMGII